MYYNKYNCYGNPKYKYSYKRNVINNYLNYSYDIKAKVDERNEQRADKAPW